MKKKILIFSGIFLAAIVFVFAMSYFQYAKPQFLYIEKVSVETDEIIIDGYNYGGMFNYLGYKTKYENGSLYVSFRGGWHMPWMPETNNPCFYPIDNKYGEELSKIYLTNLTGSQTKLIWTKEQGEILALKDNTGSIFTYSTTFKKESQPVYAEILYSSSSNVKSNDNALILYPITITSQEFANSTSPSAYSVWSEWRINCAYGRRTLRNECYA